MARQEETPESLGGERGLQSDTTDDFSTAVDGLSTDLKSWCFGNDRPMRRACVAEPRIPTRRRVITQTPARLRPARIASDPSVFPARRLVGAFGGRSSTAVFL